MKPAFFGLLALGVTKVSLVADPALQTNIKEPVVFSQATVAETLPELVADGEHWRGLGYYPVKIHAFVDSNTNRRYSAVWHKDWNILDGASFVNLSSAELSAHNDHFDAEGFRVASYSAFSDGGEIFYNAVWLKQREQLHHRRYRKRTEAGLVDEAADAAVDGYSPVEINGWGHQGGTFFSSTWTRDHRDFHYAVELTEAAWEAVHSVQRNLGRSLRDTCVYRNGNQQLRYAGIWVDDPSIHVHWRDLSTDPPWLNHPANTAYRRNDFGSVLEYRKQNFRYDDISGFVDNVAGTKISYILHRVETPNVLRSNEAIGAANEADIVANISDLLDGSSGITARVAFFVQDLRNGNWIAFNPHDHVYISSTRKVIIGTSFLAQDPSLDTIVGLTPEIYRDHSSGGRFDKADVGDFHLLDEHLSKMLTPSDNTAADYISGLVGGNAPQMQALHQSVGTRNFSEFIGKAQQEAHFLSYREGYGDIFDLPPHVLLDRLTADDQTNGLGPSDFQWASEDDLTWFDNHGGMGRRSVGIENHFASLRQNMTASSFGKFFWALANGALLDDNQRGLLLDRMQSADLSLLPNQNLYDAVVQKNGASQNNRCWVGMTYDYDGIAQSNFDVTPRFSFVFLSEQINADRFTGDSDALRTALANRASALFRDCFSVLDGLPSPPPPMDFANWSRCFPSIIDPGGGFADPNGDSDKDGLPAILERLLGTNPEIPTFKGGADPAYHSRPDLEHREDGTIRYSYRIAPDLVDDPNNTYSHWIQTSTDARTWIDHEPRPSADGPDSFELVLDPASDGSRALVRLAIVENTPSPER